MKKENKREAELEFNVEVKENDQIIAFCTSCHTVVFKGNDATAIENRVLRKSLVSHLNYYDWEHEIDIIYINRDDDSIVNAEVFLSTGSRITAREGLKDLVRREHRLL